MKKFSVRNIVIYLITIIFLLPVYWLVISSVKSDMEITKFPPTFWPEVFKFENFTYVWKFLHFGQSFFNSIFVSVSVTILIVVFSTMAGYAFAKKEFFGRKTIMTILIATMTIPATVLLLPLFFIIKGVGLYDNLFGLIFPFGVSVFGIFFMKQYMEEVPNSLIEAARIDGCNEWRIFLNVVVPLVKPGMITLAIIEFVNNWNSFTMPLVLLNSPDKYTLPLRLGLLAQNSESLQWSHIMAANLLTILPVILIFLFLQKKIIKGIMAGAVKG